MPFKDLATQRQRLSRRWYCANLQKDLTKTDRAAVIGALRLAPYPSSSQPAFSRRQVPRQWWSLADLIEM